MSAFLNLHHVLSLLYSPGWRRFSQDQPVSIMTRTACRSYRRHVMSEHANGWVWESLRRPGLPLLPRLRRKTSSRPRHRSWCRQEQCRVDCNGQTGRLLVEVHASRTEGLSKRSQLVGVLYIEDLSPPDTLAMRSHRRGCVDSDWPPRQKALSCFTTPDAGTARCSSSSADLLTHPLPPLILLFLLNRHVFIAPFRIPPACCHPQCWYPRSYRLLLFDRRPTLGFRLAWTSDPTSLP